MDEVAAVHLAGSLEEGDRGGHIEPDEVEPVNFGWSYSAGGAMDDRIGLKVQRQLASCVRVGDIDLLDSHIGEIGEERETGRRISNRIDVAGCVSPRCLTML